MNRPGLLIPLLALFLLFGQLGQAQEYQFHITGQPHVRRGAPVPIQVTVVDSSVTGGGRGVPGYANTITFASSDTAARLPLPSTFAAADKGRADFVVVFNTVGFHTLTVSDGRVTGQSHMFKVTAQEPTEKIYFGDIHSHTVFSDASANFLDVYANYDYARNTAGLDFAAVTDHDSLANWEERTTPLEWEVLKAAAEQANAPGLFVTLLGYEWTSGNPGDPGNSGHRNVYFANRDQAKILAHLDPRYDTAEKLWQGLAHIGPAEVLTVPHHLGRPISPTNFSWHDPLRERVVEIYSSHGSYESYEADSFRPFYGRMQGKNARDGWGKHGYRFGVIGASDHHETYCGSLKRSSNTGQLPWSTGLAAVSAQKLTRRGIMQGLFQRHCYATTGERILLDFFVDNHPMGSEFAVSSADHVPEIRIEAAGTREITRLELIKYCIVTGEWRVIHKAAPRTQVVELVLRDTGFIGSSLYYCRVSQDQGLLADEAEMAWSSPVWVDLQPAAGTLFPKTPQTGR